MFMFSSIVNSNDSWSWKTSGKNEKKIFLEKKKTNKPKKNKSKKQLNAKKCKWTKPFFLLFGCAFRLLLCFCDFADLLFVFFILFACFLFFSSLLILRINDGLVNIAQCVVSVSISFGVSRWLTWAYSHRFLNKL